MHPGGAELPGIYDHLNLNDWPFSVVPRREHCTFIAGRPELVTDIEELLRNLSRRDTSSIHVFWSWFGAGKTHSLHYLSNRATTINEAGPPVQLLPVYTEFPRSVKGFVDLYKAFMSSIDIRIFAEAFLELGTSPQQQEIYGQLMATNPDLANALRVLAMGDHKEQAVAIRWLRADNLPPSEFRAVGITQKISTSELATQTLGSLLNVLTSAEQSKGRQGHRLIWLIDEFQRLEHGGRAAIIDVNAGLHSLFNSCPAGLSLVLSFSGQPDPKNLPKWFSHELRDRIGVTKVMVLPPFQRTEARKFVVDVLKHFRQGTNKVSDVYPFTNDSCGAIFDYLEKNGSLRPRFVMDAFNAVLQKADRKIEEGEFKSIGAEFARSVLAEHVIVSEEEDA